MDYFWTAFWYGKLYSIQAIAAYLAFSLVLGLTGRRSYRDWRHLPWGRMAAELLFLVYLFTVLSITGMFGLSFPLGDRMGQLYLVPFVGASIKMITLNVLLFVPYGFLLPLAVPSKRWSWKWILLIGVLSTLCIETLQLFNGRMFEIDDMLANTSGAALGYGLLRAGQALLCGPDRVVGVRRLAWVICIPAAALFLLSFVANGDALQREQDARYGLEKMLREEECVTGNVFYTPEGTVADDWGCYTDLRINLSNQSSSYQVESVETSVSEVVENGGYYYCVTFQPAVTIPFENNPDWTMENVTCLLYRITDGTVWYGSGTDGETLTHCGTYADQQYPFQMDETLYAVAAGTWDPDAE